MSVAIRYERPIPSVVTESSPPTYRPQFAEAPDCGGHAREAPESHQGRSSEAPDAGFGRMGHMEHQFSHGRSQS